SMHPFLSKALVALTLWSGTGLAVTSAQISEAAEQRSLSCIAADASALVASTCQSYAEVVTAALAAS
ncbi:MAG: hypothetical protein KGL22_04940, partial [Alphaproteobacteria bacterium]|nr:hypothetical protein [Alphaproteobacteria bacterium]